MINKPLDQSSATTQNLPQFSARNYRIKFSRTQIAINIILKIPIVGHMIKFVYRLLTNRDIFEYTYNAQNALNSKCFSITHNNNIRIYRSGFQNLLKNSKPTVITFSTNENGEFKKGFSNDVLSSYSEDEDAPFTKTFSSLTQANYVDESGDVGSIRSFKPSNILRNQGVEQLYGLILKENQEQDAPFTKAQLQEIIVKLFHFAKEHRKTDKVVINLPLQSCGIDIADTGKYLNNKALLKQIISTADYCMRYYTATDPNIKIELNIFVSPEEEYGNNQVFNDMLNDINSEFISNLENLAEQTNDFLQNKIMHLIPHKTKKEQITKITTETSTQTITEESTITDETINNWKKHLQQASQTPFYLADGIKAYSGCLTRPDLFGKAECIASETNPELTQSSGVADKTVFAACENKLKLQKFLTSARDYLVKKLKNQGELPITRAIRTPSYALKKYGVKHIFHVATQTESEHELYRSNYNLMKLAKKENGYNNIAMPLLGLDNFSLAKSFELYMKAYKQIKKTYPEFNSVLILPYDKTKPQQLEDLAKLAAEYNKKSPDITAYLPQNYAENIEPAKIQTKNHLPKTRII